MEIHSAKWGIKQIISMIKKETILFDYPIQRSGEQWTHKQKSELIHSILFGLPVPAVYFLRFYEKREGSVKPVPVRWVLDGKQRLTTINSYINDEFTILETSLPIYIDGEVVEIAGLKYSELPEEVQDLLIGEGIPNYTIDKEYTTDEEIELLFNRMNSSKPLTIHQKVKSLMGIKFSTLLNDLGDHKTILELSNFPPGQIRDNKHQAAILQTMMILEKFKYRGFSAAETSRYAETVKNDLEGKIETLAKVEKALDYLAKVFTKKEKFLLKAVSFPMTVALAYNAIDRGIEPDFFALWSVAFNDAVLGEKEVNIPTNYLDYTSSGSTDLSKVHGRINAMQEHFDEFMLVVAENKEVENIA